MPSRLRKREDIPVDTLELDDSYDWVKVRRWTTAQDRDEINDRLTKIDVEKGTGRFEAVNANRANALQVLVEWGGPGLCVEDHPDEATPDSLKAEKHTCTPVPINFENVSMLRDSDLRRIISHVGARNPKSVSPTKGENGESGGPFPKGTLVTAS